MVQLGLNVWEGEAKVILSNFGKVTRADFASTLPYVYTWQIKIIINNKIVQKKNEVIILIKFNFPFISVGT